MKKLIMFFAGLLLMMIMFASLFLAGAIYDTGKKATVETYFFQPNDSPDRRPGVPASPSDLTTDKVRNMLVRRYITEYFYVVPNTQNVETRMSGQTSLRFMSSNDAFQYWLNNIAPQIQEMAEQRKLRLVQLTNVEKATDEKNYWIVEYDLITWDKPNDLSVQPVVTHGQIYLNLFYDGMRDELNGKTIEELLESGTDPAVAFKFGVWTVSSYDEQK